DLGDPECYLAAERMMSELPVVPEWEPVLSAHLMGGRAVGRETGQAPGGAFAAMPDRIAEREWLERRVAKLGIQPIRWPAGWPPDSREAMLAATYAKRIGRAV